MTTPGGKRSVRELIAYYLYHTRANHPSFYHVPLLQLGDDRAVFFLRVLHAHDRLMEVRIEGLILRLDIFEAFFFQRLDKLLVHHLDARAEPAFVGTLRRQRPLEIVEERQEVLQEVLCHHSGELFLLLPRTAAEILEIRLQTQIPVFLFGKLRLIFFFQRVGVLRLLSRLRLRGVSLGVFERRLRRVLIERAALRLLLRQSFFLRYFQGLYF